MRESRQGKVGQRREVVARQRRLAREPVARELHPVAGVTGKADDHAIELLYRLGHGLTVPIRRAAVTGWSRGADAWPPRSAQIDRPLSSVPGDAHRA